MESEQTERTQIGQRDCEQERNQIKEINKWREKNERTKSGCGFFQQASAHTHTTHKPYTSVRTGTRASKWVWMWNGKEQRKRLYRTPKVQNGFQLFHALCIHVAAPKFIVVYPQPHISDAEALLALINKDWKERRRRKSNVCADWLSFWMCVRISFLLQMKASMRVAAENELPNALLSCPWLGQAFILEMESTTRKTANFWKLH